MSIEELEHEIMGWPVVAEVDVRHVFDSNGHTTLCITVHMLSRGRFVQCSDVHAGILKLVGTEPCSVVMV